MRDLTGIRSGKLVALYMLDQKDKHNSYLWRVQCDCGTEKTIPSRCFFSRKSCGCGRQNWAYTPAWLGAKSAFADLLGRTNHRESGEIIAYVGDSPDYIIPYDSTKQNISNLNSDYFIGAFDRECPTDQLREDYLETLRHLAKKSYISWETAFDAVVTALWKRKT